MEDVLTFDDDTEYLSVLTGDNGTWEFPAWEVPAHQTFPPETYDEAQVSNFLLPYNRLRFG